MKRQSLIISIASVLFAAGSGWAQNHQKGDVFAEHLIPPALILSQAEAIDVGEDQREKMIAVVQNAQREIGKSQQMLKSAYEELAEKLARFPIDEAAALEKLDRVLELERGIKRQHLQMLVGVNNQLTPEQQARLKSIKPHAKERSEPLEVTEKRLRGKIEQLKGIAEGLAAEGQSPAHIHEMMKVFTSHMEKGQIDQAEALLDGTLKKLRGDGGGDKGAGIDPEALKEEIESMRVEDVAWRKIAWKTCLLDGIRASREQNKPVVLWVFIDRPIDDKRC